MYDADLGPSIAPSLANVLLPTLAEVETSSILSEPPPSISDLPPPTPLPPEPLEMEPPPPDADELSYASSSSPSSEECTPAASPDPGDDRGALLRQIESFKKKGLYNLIKRVRVLNSVPLIQTMFLFQLDSVKSSLNSNCLLQFRGTAFCVPPLFDLTLSLYTHQLFTTHFNLSNPAGSPVVNLHKELTTI